MRRPQAWLVLAVLLGIVAIYSALWANWSWVYTHDRYVQLPPGASSSDTNGYDLRVRAIRAVEPGDFDSYSTDVVDGSVVIEVVAEARRNANRPGESLYCAAPLVAAGREWDPASGSFADDRITECENEGPLNDQWRSFSMAYVIPEQYADQLNGVVVYHYDGTPGEVLRP